MKRTTLLPALVIALAAAWAASVPAASQSTEEPLPDFVEMEDGTTLRLGGDLPEGPEWGARDREGPGRIGSGTVIGLGPTDEIEAVGDGEGRIWSLSVTLGDDVDYEALLAALTDRFGEPTRGSATERPGVRMESAIWGDGSVWVHLDRSRWEEGEVSVVYRLMRER